MAPRLALFVVSGAALACCSSAAVGEACSWALQHDAAASEEVAGVYLLSRHVRALSAQLPGSLPGSLPVEPQEGLDDLPKQVGKGIAESITEPLKEKGLIPKNATTKYVDAMGEFVAELAEGYAQDLGLTGPHYAPPNYSSPLNTLLDSVPFIYSLVWHRSSYNCSQTLVQWLDSTYSAEKARKVEILDVGGGTGGLEKFIYNSTSKPFNWSCVDVTPTETCNYYAGDHLYMPEKSKHIVMFVDILHHAVDHTLDLLSDAARVARDYVIVLEDLRATNFTEAALEFNHEWNGFFRSAKEWESLFGLLGFTVKHQATPDYYCAYPDLFHVQRRLWVLEPPSPPAVSLAKK
eukprot:CAMPEP_0195066434 /NCGR_PEP_ID=MMETSP0448-20130528/11788_1 /TAXON_ID=66468 /ORGANISM="Heterocapsa triquestra, Strain CCMP 448" /LENGTH=348 /DNA_ID=CAMNT_0040097685 /DNA_START=79 /DNA_END=1125 /DNA_ORIENTATION=-